MEYRLENGVQKYVNFYNVHICIKRTKLLDFQLLKGGMGVAFGNINKKRNFAHHLGTIYPRKREKRK